MFGLCCVSRLMASEKHVKEFYVKFKNTKLKFGLQRGRGTVTGVGFRFCIRESASHAGPISHYRVLQAAPVSKVLLGWLLF